MIREFPGKDRIQDPMLDLRYSVEIGALPHAIWPWIKQMGYHRGGWYIDAWWNRLIEEQFWPRVVPEDARGTFKPSASQILPEYQDLKIGDIVPDGPPGSAYYEVIDIKEHHLLLLFATSHFKYVAPRFVYKTRFAPKGAFCWAFLLDQAGPASTRLTSWWQAEVQPRTLFRILSPIFKAIDRFHQRELLKGIKRRAEGSAS